MGRTKIEVNTSIFGQRIKLIYVTVGNRTTSASVLQKALEKCSMNDISLRYQLCAVSKTSDHKRLLKDDERPSEVQGSFKDAPQFMVVLRQSGYLRVHYRVDKGYETFHSFVVTPNMTTRDLVQVAVKTFAPALRADSFVLVKRECGIEEVMDALASPFFCQGSFQLELRRIKCAGAAGTTLERAAVLDDSHSLPSDEESKSQASTGGSGSFSDMNIPHDSIRERSRSLGVTVTESNKWVRYSQARLQHGVFKPTLKPTCNEPNSHNPSDHSLWIRLEAEQVRGIELEEQVSQLKESVEQLRNELSESRLVAATKEQEACSLQEQLESIKSCPSGMLAPSQMLVNKTVQGSISKWGIPPVAGSEVPGPFTPSTGPDAVQDPTTQRGILMAGTELSTLDPGAASTHQMVPSLFEHLQGYTVLAVNIQHPDPMDGLGFQYERTDNAPLSGVETIVVKNVQRKPSLVEVGDRILEVNGYPCFGALLYKALEVLEKATGQIQLVIARDKSLEASNVEPHENGNGCSPPGEVDVASLRDQLAEANTRCSLLQEELQKVRSQLLSTADDYDLLETQHGELVACCADEIDEAGSLVGEFRPLLTELRNQLVEEQHMEHAHITLLKDFQKLKEANQELVTQVGTLESSAIDLAKDADELREVLASIRAENDEMKFKFSHLGHQHSQLKQRMESVIEENEQLKSDVSHIGQESSEFQLRLATVIKENDRLKLEVSCLDHERSELQQRMQSAVKENDVLKSNITRMGQESLEHQDRMAAVMKENDQLKSDIFQMNHEHLNLQQKIGSMNTENEQLKFDVSHLHKKHQQMMDTASDQLKSGISQVHHEYSELQQRMAVMTNENETLKIDVSHMGQELLQLQQRLSSVIKENEQLKGDISHMGHKNLELCERTKLLSKENDQLKVELQQKTESLNKEMKEHIDQVMALKVSMVSLEDALRLAQSARSETMEEIAFLQKELEAGAEHTEGLAIENENLAMGLKASHGKEASLSKAISQLHDEVRLLKKHEHSSSAENTKLKQLYLAVQMELEKKVSELGQLQRKMEQVLQKRKALLDHLQVVGQTMECIQREVIVVHDEVDAQEDHHDHLCMPPLTMKKLVEESCISQENEEVAIAVHREETIDVGDVQNKEQNSSEKGKKQGPMELGGGPMERGGGPMERGGGPMELGGEDADCSEVMACELLSRIELVQSEIEDSLIKKRQQYETHQDARQKKLEQLLFNNTSLTNLVASLRLELDDCKRALENKHVEFEVFAAASDQLKFMLAELQLKSEQQARDAAEVATFLTKQKEQAMVDLVAEREKNLALAARLKELQSGYTDLVTPEQLQDNQSCLNSLQEQLSKKETEVAALQDRLVRTEYELTSKLHPPGVVGGAEIIALNERLQTRASLKEVKGYEPTECIKVYQDEHKMWEEKARISKEAADLHQTDLCNVCAIVAAITEEKENALTDLRETERKAQDLRKEVEQLKYDLAQLQVTYNKDVEKHRNFTKEMEAKVSSLETSLEASLKQMKESEHLKAINAETIRKLENTCDRLETSLALSEESLNQNQLIIDEMNSKQMDITQDLEKTKGQKQIFEDQLVQMKSEVDDLLNKVSMLESNLETCQKQLKDSEQLRSDDAETITNLQTKCNKLEINLAAKEDHLTPKGDHLTPERVLRQHPEQSDTTLSSSSKHECPPHSGQLDGTKPEVVKKASSDLHEEVVQLRKALLDSPKRQLPKEFAARLETVKTKLEVLLHDQEGKDKQLKQSKRMLEELQASNLGLTINLEVANKTLREKEAETEFLEKELCRLATLVAEQAETIKTREELLAREEHSHKLAQQDLKAVLEAQQALQRNLSTKRDESEPVALRALIAQPFQKVSDETCGVTQQRHANGVPDQDSKLQANLKNSRSVHSENSIQESAVVGQQSSAFRSEGTRTNRDTDS